MNIISSRVTVALVIWKAIDLKQFSVRKEKYTNKTSYCLRTHHIRRFGSQRLLAGRKPLKKIFESNKNTACLPLKINCIGLYEIKLNFVVSFVVLRTFQAICYI